MLGVVGTLREANDPRPSYDLTEDQHDDRTDALNAVGAPYLAALKRRTMQHVITSLLSCVMMIVVAGLLMLPAITISNDTASRTDGIVLASDALEAAPVKQPGDEQVAPSNDASEAGELETGLPAAASETDVDAVGVNDQTVSGNEDSDAIAPEGGASDEQIDDADGSGVAEPVNGEGGELGHDAATPGAFAHAGDEANEPAEGDEAFGTDGTADEVASMPDGGDEATDNPEDPEKEPADEPHGESDIVIGDDEAAMPEEGISDEPMMNDGEADADERTNDGEPGDNELDQDATNDVDGEHKDANPDDDDAIVGDEKDEEAKETKESKDDEEAKASVLNALGETYEITVTCGPKAGIPDDATLSVHEILTSEDIFDEYLTRVNAALDGDVGNVRMFDISIMVDGQKVQPSEAVRVEIALTDGINLSGAVHALHFADTTPATRSAAAKGAKATRSVVSAQPDVLDANVSDGVVSFATDSFSVYAIIDAPEPAPATGWYQIATLEKVLELATSEGVYIRNPNGYYFTNETYNVNATRTGIKKVGRVSSPDATEDAVLYYFELAGEATDESAQIKAYCYDDNHRKQYVKQEGNSLSFTTEDEANIFTIDAFPNTSNMFRVAGNDGYYWNMQGGNGGGGFAAWQNATDTNARLQFEYYESQEDDPYGLAGKSFGIAFHDESTMSAALTTDGITVSNQQRLAGQDTTMKPDVLDNDGVLLVAEGTDIQMWTFESQGADKYYLTTEVDGQKKYLTIRNNNVTLEDEPDETSSLIKATPGTGTHAGRWHFSVGNYSLNFTGSATNGFNAVTGNSDRTWMNLVQKSKTLDDDDFIIRTAQKVSVSDLENVHDGQQVIIYTRAWNNDTKRYEFYIIDHDGSLIRCYDTGDNIEWIGSQVNTALWAFTEYHNSNGTPNYYYELENVQYRKTYIAPQMISEQVLSDSTIGVNLNGRRYGHSSTTIIAWDDLNYSYAGLKVENGQLVACSLSDAEDFYFAIMSTTTTAEGELTTAATVDSNAYGIEMRMIDFNNRIIGPADNSRDSKQYEFFGGDNNNPGLLSTNLEENGYPTSTEVTGRAGHSLNELFDNTTPVNHLFLQGTYTESGYFEYDSTSNFAHLNADGTFTVYDQLGAVGDYISPTNRHGQFMPYNDLYVTDENGNYVLDAEGNRILRDACDFTNQTNVLAQELPDTAARKGETLYNIGNRAEVDFHFGMEITATFTQTADGLDAWGHDIIFEFSGDDDFWLYVDGELVLDLGGVHPAMVGSVNFRTGEVESARGNSTLYDIFKQHYQDRGMSEGEINAKLDELFEQKNVDGQDVYVFKDYSNHTMRIFYMERGAGASNLHMRFNLAAVQPGTFLLSKTLSGTDNPSNDLIEFPYQIWYVSETDSELHMLDQSHANAGYVTYKDTVTNVTFHDSYTPAGGTEAYENVFMLKPGQTAQVKLPEDAVNYYVVECGVNPDVYDQVKINGEVANGATDRDITTSNLVGDTARHDYRSTTETLKERSKVDFDNHVKAGTMRTLTLTKRLYDDTGENILSYPDEDNSLFNLRLYLGNENANSDSLPGANLYSYYVKNPSDEYCRWDATEQDFVSLGITEYAVLAAYLDGITGAEVDNIVFKTSPNGSITKIPAGYSVEARDLVVGTQYKVEERDYEIPRGYTLRLEDGYTRVDIDPEDPHATPYSNTIKTESEEPTDPEIEVRNQKGWGLTVKKVWSDKDFMAVHDSIYIAVYVRQSDDEGATTTEVLLDDEGSVRELKTTEDEVYFFFDNLLATTPFEDYVVREVTLTGDFVVDDKGRVSGYDTIAPILEGGTLGIGGQPINGEYSEDGYVYTVTYEVGQDTGHNHNVRTDTVTNSRPGIKLFKTDWAGEALTGAVFTLKDSDENDVAAETYTSSGDDGLITIVYVSPGTYTLTEIETPKGYVVLDAPMEITVAADGRIAVAGVERSFYTLTQATDEEMASITIKNRTSELELRKVNSSSPDVVVANAHFELYRQVTDDNGNPRKDYQPMEDYEDLVTNENGVLEEITIANLYSGTYYLEETQAAPTYELLLEDLCFTIGNDGTVTVESGGESSWLVANDDGEGHVTFVLSVPNDKKKLVQFKKVDIASPDNSALPGATFDLYRVVNGNREETPLMSNLVSGEDGLLSDGQTTQFSLPDGIYELVEVTPPSGYNYNTEAVTVTVTRSGVTYDEGTSLSSSGSGVSSQENVDGMVVYTIKISNSAGVELPNTGGPGAGALYLLGIIMIVGAAIWLRRTAMERRNSAASNVPSIR